MSIDVEALLNATVGSLETEFEVIPEGEYTAMIDTTDVRTWLASFTRDDGSTSHQINVPFVILNEPALMATMNRQKLTTRQTIWLDIDNGKIASGKNQNVILGQLRAALGQNNEPNWTVARLPGAGPVKIKTGITVSKKDGRKFSDVKLVSVA